MSILRSISFHKEPLNPDVMYQLFKDLPNCKDFDSSIEIIEAAMEGRINLDEEFNLAGYDYAIKNNKKMDKSKKANKVVSLDDNEDDNAAVDRILSQCTTVDQYEALLDEDELHYAVNKLMSLRNEFIADAGVDYIVTIRLALSGIPDAINCLRDLCENYPPLSEHIQIVLASGIPFEELFPEKVVNSSIKIEVVSEISEVSEVVVINSEVKEVSEVVVYNAEEEEISGVIDINAELEEVSEIVEFNAEVQEVTEVVEPIVGYAEAANNIISMESYIKKRENPKGGLSEVCLVADNHELHSKVSRLNEYRWLHSAFYQNRRDGCVACGSGHSGNVILFHRSNTLFEYLKGREPCSNYTRKLLNVTDIIRIRDGTGVCDLPVAVGT